MNEKRIDLNVNIGFAAIILGTEIILYKIIAKILDSKKEKTN